MASPVQEGTFSGSAVSSRDIDILKEKIYLKIDKDFRTAFYQIEYWIRTDTDGKQIPLLFYAKDYQGNFKIWVDNQEVKLLDIPEEYKTTANTPFEKFSNSFEQSSPNVEPEIVLIYWKKHTGFVYNLNDLKYFETDLSKGVHHIRVEYVAKVWIDVSGWVKEYSFRYSLSPAKNWKSYGSLEITIDASEFNYPLKTNLGQQTQGQSDATLVWNFSKLPADYIEVVYKPEISAFAKTMIAIGPAGLTLIFTLCISILHFLSINIYRRNKPTKKFSWVVIAGSIAIPLLILISYGDF